MKTNFLRFFALILLFVSCSTDNNDPVNPETPEPGEEVKDTFNYLALRADGNLYEIGNKTGVVTRAGAISEMQGNLNMVPNAVTASEEKIFIYEQIFDPFHGRILVMDKETGTVQNFVLDFPADIYGENAGLNSLDWDTSESNLVGIVKNEIEFNVNNTSRVVRIDPETMELEYQEISFERNITFSSSLFQEKLFALSSMSGNFEESELLEIDLAAKSVNSLEFSETGAFIGNLSNNGRDDFLFGLLPIQSSTYMGEMEAYKLNLSTYELEKLTGLPRFSGHHFARKSFYSKKYREFAELILKDNKHQLLQYNHQKDEIGILELTGAEGFDTSTILIGVRAID